jgi:hypothetical protein
VSGGLRRRAQPAACRHALGAWPVFGQVQDSHRPHLANGVSTKHSLLIIASVTDVSTPAHASAWLQDFLTIEAGDKGFADMPKKCCDPRRLIVRWAWQRRCAVAGVPLGGGAWRRRLVQQISRQAEPRLRRRATLHASRPSSASRTRSVFPEESANLLAAVLLVEEDLGCAHGSAFGSGGHGRGPCQTRWRGRTLPPIAATLAYSYCSCGSRACLSHDQFSGGSQDDWHVIVNLLCFVYLD